MTAIMTVVLVLIQQIMPRGLRSDTEEAELFDTPFQQQIQRPWELWKSKVMKVSKNE